MTPHLYTHRVNEPLKIRNGNEPEESGRRDHIEGILDAVQTSLFGLATP